MGGLWEGFLTPIAVPPLSRLKISPTVSIKLSLFNIRH